MLKKIIITSLFVGCVFSKSTFIGNTKRAELFELTDDEVAVFRVTLPENEYLQLKEEASAGLPLPPPPIEIDEYGNLLSPPPPPPPDGLSLFPEDTFKTKNASMIVELNNEVRSFEKINFSLGGSSSRMFGKKSFNIKIRGKDELYGRVHLRLRPDAREPTFLRSKLSCDIHNRLGLPSISSNYATLYINDEYMGFYNLLDAYKLSWVEREYGEKDSTTLIQCKNAATYLTVESSSTQCKNENEKVTDNSEWIELLALLDAAESAEDIEDIFDVDQFLTEIAFEYLSGSWDHFLHFGHNYYLYKPKNDKWKFLLYDYDGELGQSSVMAILGGPTQDIPIRKTNSTDFPTYTFEEWTQPRHLVDILILKDSTRFDNILRDFVTRAFNPAVLFPHIDELKKFIRPYVELDKIPDENGKLPGHLGQQENEYTLAEWEANSEFTRVDCADGVGSSYGLKYWILAKYRYVCKAYNMECDPVYLDENYEIPIDKEVEAHDPMAHSTNSQPVAASSTDAEPTTTTDAAESAATTDVAEAAATTSVAKLDASKESKVVKKSNKSHKKPHFNKHRFNKHRFNKHRFNKHDY